MIRSGESGVATRYIHIGKFMQRLLELIENRQVRLACLARERTRSSGDVTPYYGAQHANRILDLGTY